MLIPCPFCGPREHAEYAYGGDATVRRPDEQTPAWGPAWQAYVFQRANPRGAHLEYWQHVAGCRQWLVVTRDTLTHEIEGAGFAEDGPGCDTPIGDRAGGTDG
jgi:heterotetrameric sarcosine oxidase delta subunit